MGANGKSMTRLPTYFISHGGGPWPWLTAEMPGVYDKLADSLRAMPRDLGARPRAVLAVSGHWEEDAFTVMSGAEPPMVYDYSGFPAHTYRIKYPAPGSPEVAARVRELLTRAGIRSREDETRGFDHGVFAPLRVIYPEADHGFHADYRPTYHRESAADGWRRLLAWFKKYGAA